MKIYWVFSFQFERGEALEKITQSVKAKLEEENDEDSLKFLSKAVDTVRKQVYHINFFTKSYNGVPLLLQLYGRNCVCFMPISLFGEILY